MIEICCDVCGQTMPDHSNRGECTVPEFVGSRFTWPEPEPEPDPIELPEDVVVWADAVTAALVALGVDPGNKIDYGVEAFLEFFTEKIAAVKKDKEDVTELLTKINRLVTKYGAGGAPSRPRSRTPRKKVASASPKAMSDKDCIELGETLPGELLDKQILAEQWNVEQGHSPDGTVLAALLRAKELRAS